jgi:hypothetical protein
MQMVSAAFNHLCEKLKAGEVAADVVQKLSQLVSDLANRNFVNASAIQTVSACYTSQRHHLVLTGIVLHCLALYCIALPCALLCCVVLCCIIPIDVT